MKSFLSPASLALALSSFSVVSCLEAGDADQVYTDWNNAFLKRQGSEASYKLHVKSEVEDKGWTLARDIFAPEDVYFRRGDDDSRDTIRALASTWLASRPTKGWPGDCWNDDIAWYTIMFIRAHQTTGNSSFLEAAQFGNDLVWDRGWNTTSNDGGIWETQPNACGGGNHTIIKQALSTVPNGLTSCFIYQSTHNDTYLDRCKTIYEWTRTHLFNTTTGVLLNGVYPDGSIDAVKTFTDLGRWIEYANFLWMASGDQKYYSDAKVAADYGLHTSLKKNGGIVSDPGSAVYDLGGPIGRGAGHFMRDNQLWDAYYEQFVNNSDHILKNRDPEYHLTSNDWLTPNTYNNTSEKTVLDYASAVTWLQYTPPFKPSNLTVGIHTISNVHTKLFLTSTSSFRSHQSVDMRVATNESTQTQRWRFTPNDYKPDSSFDLVNLHSWQALTADNGTATAISQDFALRTENQRWHVEKVGNNTYSIINKATGLALDGGFSSGNTTRLTQANYTGADCQKWYIEPLSRPIVA